MGKNQKRTSFQAAVSTVRKNEKGDGQELGAGLPEPVSQVLMDENAI